MERSKWNLQLIPQASNWFLKYFEFTEIQLANIQINEFKPSKTKENATVLIQQIRIYI